MSCALATICLNEIEWLEKLYEQHKNWPDMLRWVFVESADIMYAKSNPDKVSCNGLSIDGTSEFSSELSKKDERIIYIPYGFCGVDGKYPLDQHKCESRNVYLDQLEDVNPDLLIVVDADEMYSYKDQQAISKLLSFDTRKVRYHGSAFCLKQRHIWYPPYLQTKLGKIRHMDYGLFTHEIVGGYWEVIHCRVWKWEKGLRYKRNHNWPEDINGTYLINKGQQMIHPNMSIHKRVMGIDSPECIHLGYASKAEYRNAKCAYYEERGEGKEPDRALQQRRKMYVECRNAYKAWEPGVKLPHGSRVIEYTGQVPEVFLKESNEQ